MSKINAICVYCGSSPGTDPAFVEAAQKFGKILAENGVRLGLRRRLGRPDGRDRRKPCSTTAAR